MRNNEYEFQYPEFQEEMEEHRQQHMYAQEQMTGGEKAHFIAGAVMAGLAILAVFGVVFFLFLLFCTKVWFV